MGLDMQDDAGGDGLSAVEESDRDPCCDGMRGIDAVWEEKLDNTGSALPSQPCTACGTEQRSRCGRAPSHESGAPLPNHAKGL